MFIAFKNIYMEYIYYKVQSTKKKTVMKAVISLTK